MNRRHALRISALLALGSLALVGGCKKTDDPNGASDDNVAAKTTATTPETATEPAGSIVVYSGRTEKLIAPAFEGFESAGEVDLKIKYADTAELAATMLEEGDKSPADVFVAQDASTLSYLSSEGVFAPLSDSITGLVPKGYRAEDGRWIGLSGRARVLAYNTEKLGPEDLPESIDALTEKKWKGRVGWAPENASFQSFVAAMIKLRGRDETATWLEAMKKNDPVDYPKNTPAVMAVSRGEVDVALVNHYYLYRLREEHGEDFPVDNHYFKSGDAASLVNLSGAGILETSKNREAAEKLLTYLLTEEGQKHFVVGNHEFPVASGVTSPIGLPVVENLEAPAIDPAELGNLEETVALLRETGVLK